MSRNICAVGAALFCVLSGVSCEISSSGSDWEARKKELQNNVRGDQATAYLDNVEQRVRQAVADRYRGRVQHGLGCGPCPEYCAWVDLRAIDATAFQKEFRQVLIDGVSRDLYTRRMSVYEHNRLTCILNVHKESMRDALESLLDAGEHPRVRFEAAVAAAGFGFGTSEPRRVLHELAEGSDPTAKSARALIYVWNKNGWPEED